MPDYVVSTVFKASDKVSPALAKMNKNVKLFGSSADKAFKRAGKSAKLFRTMTAANVMSRGITQGMFLARRAIGATLTSYIEFDSAIGESAAKFPIAIKRGTPAFEELGKAARKVGAETRWSAAEAAGGLRFMAMAGMQAEHAMAMLPEVAKLATAANLDLASASDMATDALGMWGMKSKDAAKQQLNLAHINDVFAKAANTSNQTVYQLFEAMTEGGGKFKQAGQSMETFAALVASLADIKKGGAAGTGLKNAIMKLTKETGPGADKLKELGVTIEDDNKNMLDMIDIIDQLRKKTAGMGSAELSGTLDTIFGARGATVMGHLMGQTDEELKVFRKSLVESEGTVDSLASEIEKSLENKLKSLQSALLETGFKFLEAFTGEGVEGLDDIIEAVRKFDVKPLVEGAQELLKAFKWLFKTVKDNWELIKGLVKAFIALKIAMTGIALVQWGAGLFSSVSGIMGRVKAMGKLADVTGRATAAGQKVGGATGGKIGGAAAGAGAVMGAAAVGAAAGTFLRETILEPVYQDMERLGTNIDNLSTRIGDQLVGFGGTTKPTTEQLLLMQKQLASMKDDVPLMTFSLENAFGQVASLFTDEKSPLEIYFDRQKRIGELNLMVAASLERLKVAANNAAVAPNAGTGSGQFKGQLDINGAPAGSTYQDTGKPGAPKVDVNLAGKN